MSEKKIKTRRRFPKKEAGAGGRRLQPARRERPPRGQAWAFHLNVAPRAARALAGIGLPAEAPFVPDEFQLAAVRLGEKNDVIVSAPTGSGKTWIAQQAVARELAGGGRCWYASPLKALSNAKFLEFRAIFGPEQVGLLTGDHKVNPEAPVIIGTTEILRNQLYDSMSDGRDLDRELVILDEAHYLGDPERGVVWEEVLIYLPPRVRLLLLSATVANSRELAAWLESHRRRKTAVVNGGERPVPLAGLCLWPSGHLADLGSAARRPGGAGGRGGGRRAFFDLQMPNSEIMGALRELDLLPAIFFLKSRADCDSALGRIGAAPREAPERFRARQELLDDYLEKYPFLAGHPQLGRIRHQAVAAHHAGHLPHFKLLVEELMSRGLLEAIFATSTVSAGVNFPARCVVVRQSDRFDGQGFSDLTANEFTQMTGRAGRRGRDLIGFALMIPGPHMDLGLMAALMDAPPDPVRSGLSLNFSMTLNLLKAHRPEGIRRLLSASLAVWQAAGAGGRGRPEARALSRAGREIQADFQRHLAFLRAEGLVDGEDRLTPDGEWAAELRLDHPLVFHAGLKAGAWPLEPAALAAAVAGLAADKESNKPPPRRKPPVKLTSALTGLVLAVGPMMDRLAAAGFATPVFNLRPAWAMWSWAGQGDFDEAVELLGLGAGDLAMLALRVADHLRQISGLPAPGRLGAAAREAVGRIIREPVSSPL
ncbi:MAG: DEAD/DEAH box helicase [Candidatus Adiutrix sp.]|nr:DEAD/DEAH box helicase [Candidatus Adiutrix sp.]